MTDYKHLLDAPTDYVVTSALREGDILLCHGCVMQLGPIKSREDEINGGKHGRVTYSKATVLYHDPVAIPLTYLDRDDEGRRRVWSIQGNDLARWSRVRSEPDFLYVVLAGSAFMGCFGGDDEAEAIEAAKIANPREEREMTAIQAGAFVLDLHRLRRDDFVEIICDVMGADTVQVHDDGLIEVWDDTVTRRGLTIDDLAAVLTLACRLLPRALKERNAA